VIGIYKKYSLFKVNEVIYFGDVCKQE